MLALVREAKLEVHSDRPMACLVPMASNKGTTKEKIIANVEDWIRILVDAIF